MAEQRMKFIGCFFLVGVTALNSLLCALTLSDVKGIQPGKTCYKHPKLGLVFWGSYSKKKAIINRTSSGVG